MLTYTQQLPHDDPDTALYKVDLHSTLMLPHVDPDTVLYHNDLHSSLMLPHVDPDTALWGPQQVSGSMGLSSTAPIVTTVILAPARPEEITGHHPFILLPLSQAMAAEYKRCSLTYSIAHKICTWFRCGLTYIDRLVQERRNSSALAMELRLSCTNPSIY